MLLKYFYDDKLAQASYMVACQANGTAIVIDPARDIAPYLQAAEANGLQIIYVTETHIHADFVSGTRELAHATGATLLLSGEGGEDWQYAFPECGTDRVQVLRDGDTIMLGNVKFDVMHTPGHTPEHITFMLTDTAAADEPMGLFTGDFLFVGDIGRPDLLEEAAGIMDTREVGARQQFANVQHFKTLPDYLQVWPGHGAGSACGKALGAVPSSTLGYEKRFSEAFRYDDEAAFVAWLLEGQPEAPRYFGQMKTVNRIGPALQVDLPEPQRLTKAADVPQGALLIDVRPREDFIKQHLMGSLSIPLNAGSFNTYVGWYVDFDQPTYLLAYDDQLAETMRLIRAIGVDHVPGYLTETALEGATATLIEMTPQAIQDAGYTILDVRGLSEYLDERIPGALHIPMGAIPKRLAEIPRDETVAVHCGSGLRSQVVASLLEAHGFTNIVNMGGGIGAWRAAGLPVETGALQNEPA